LLVVALLLPVLLALLIATGVQSRFLSVFQLPTATAASFRAPYCEGCGHWEAVQALHRLAVVAVHSFVTDTADGAVLQLFICLISVVLHVRWHPFTTASCNHTQTALLSSLVAIALLNVPQALFDSNAEVVSDSMQDRLSHMADAEEVLLFVPACVVAACVLALAWRQRRELVRCTACRSGKKPHVPAEAEPLLDFVDTDTNASAVGGSCPDMQLPLPEAEA
jgi:hypothetical protein